EHFIQLTYFAALRMLRETILDFVMSPRIALIGLTLLVSSIPAWAFNEGGSDAAPGGSKGPTRSVTAPVPADTAPAPPRPASACRKVGAPLSPEQIAERRAIVAQRLAQLTPAKIAEWRAKRAERAAQRAAQGAPLPPCPSPN